MTEFEAVSAAQAMLSAHGDVLVVGVSGEMKTVICPRVVPVHEALSKAGTQAGMALGIVTVKTTVGTDGMPTTTSDLASVIAAYQPPEAIE